MRSLLTRPERTVSDTERRLKVAVHHSVEKFAEPNTQTCTLNSTNLLLNTTTQRRRVTVRAALKAQTPPSSHAGRRTSLKHSSCAHDDAFVIIVRDAIFSKRMPQTQSDAQSPSRHRAEPFCVEPHSMHIILYSQWGRHSFSPRSVAIAIRLIRVSVTIRFSLIWSRSDG
jgi:hypothetical protein